MCELLILSKKGIWCLLVRGVIIFTDLEELVSFTSLRILRSWPLLEQWSWGLFASKNPMWYCNSSEQNELPKKAQKKGFNSILASARVILSQGGFYQWQQHRYSPQVVLGEFIMDYSYSCGRPQNS